MDETRGTVCPKDAIPEDHQEVFQRVWRRVMPRGEGPITWEDETGAPSLPLPPVPVPPTESKGAQEEKTKPREEVSPGTSGEDFPDGVPFLGGSSLSSTGVLQELLRGELEDVRYYTALSRRTGGTAGRLLAAIAAEERRHAKRLSAAGFLISGIHYWPEGEGKVPLPSYLGALRQRFQEEQQGMYAYLAAAESTQDPCLRELFLTHAREEWEHACKIRGLVEQA